MQESDPRGHADVAAALRRAEAAETTFRAFLESAPDGMVITQQGRIVLVNRQAERLFGYDRGEMVGQLVEMLLPERFRPRHVVQREGYLQHPVMRPMGAGMALAARRKDGTELPVEISLSSIETDEGLLVMSAVRDISDRVAAEARLRETAEELARSNAELEQFAYVASHDLQEPLRMVASYTQLLARRYRGQLDEDADEFIGFAVDGAQRMQRLINDLLAFSRVGTRGKAFAPTDANRVVDRVVADLALTMEEAGATVTRDELPTVEADEGQLGELFQNLLSNAVKFRRPDAPPRVHVSAEAREHDWLFSVRDNGIGMEAQYADRVFVLFQRLHTQAEYPGTGIGLAICKKIVERHGGRIWVESTPGEGSTFRFTLPRRREMHE